jgi:pimeloyl-ACP methyl ester carboxylesterase
MGALIAVLEKYCTAPVTLAGHSMGATVSMLTAGARTDLVSGLALIEPVILPDAGYAFAELPLASVLQRMTFPLAVGAAKRRDVFESKEAAAQVFTGRGVFKTFPQEVIADYVADGLVDDGKGRFRLACRPKYEASTYCAQRHNPWAALRKITDPLVLLRAEHGSTISEASMHRIASIKPDARVATVEGSTHMLPMERPDRVRSAIESAALLAQAGRKYHGME